MRNWMIFLLCLLATTAHADEEWFKYYFPADPREAADYRGVPVSVFDAGKDVLDAPAGRRGFTLARDGHFYFADGTRARFWGTNLCFDACFPDKKQAEILAGRIAYFGFNAVRLHHMDFYFEPRGIFRDTAPAYKDYQLKPTGHLSPGQLDKLDYLIYQLKRRGIYININTLVSRRFTEADGVPEADQFSIAAKPASLFDARLIELQKKYSKDLLDHLNPYTKLRYRDDPSICMVEITNENTLTGLKPSTLPEYYRDGYEKLFSSWLARTDRKADDGPAAELLPGLAAWTMERHSGAEMSQVLEAVPNEAGEAVPTAVILAVKGVTPTAWHLQFRCAGVKLRKNKTYMLKFSARADRPMTLGAVSQQAYEPWENLGLSETVKLADQFQAFEMPFEARLDCDNAKAGFITGYGPGLITIKDISLRESPRAALIKEFNAYLEGKYYREMRAFLRDEVGVKCPIGVGGHWNPAQEALQEKFLDYVDRHAYWDHPRFPNKPWDNSDFRIHNKSILDDPKRGFVAAVTRGSAARPHTLTEWNHCYPNEYAYETPLLLARAARENDWDALFQFAFAHSGRNIENVSNIDSYFNINPNAQQLILCSFASRIFLKNEPVAFDITEDRAAVRYGKYTVEVGKIKNTGSGWGQDGRFDWGRFPTLMEQTD